MYRSDQDASVSLLAEKVFGAQHFEGLKVCGPQGRHHPGIDAALYRLDLTGNAERHPLNREARGSLFVHPKGLLLECSKERADAGPVTAFQRAKGRLPPEICVLETPHLRGLSLGSPRRGK